MLGLYDVSFGSIYDSVQVDRRIPGRVFNQVVRIILFGSCMTKAQQRGLGTTVDGVIVSAGVVAITTATVQ